MLSNGQVEMGHGAGNMTNLMVCIGDVGDLCEISPARSM